MKNAKLIVIWSVLLGILIIAGVGAYLWENEFFVDKNVAIATTQRGEVMHIVGSEAIAVPWQTKVVVGESIQTLDGEALVTINENHFLWIKPNSKVTLTAIDKDQVIMTLDNGDVWYMHVNVSDKQKFTLLNELSAINPLGTKFFSTFNADTKTTSTFVIDGKVKVSDDFVDLYLEPFEKSYKTDVDGLVKVELSSADKEIAKYQLDRDYAILKSARNVEINKHGTVLAIVKSKFNVTDEIIQETLAKLDSGELNEQQLLEQSPVPIPAIGRLKELNAAAKETLLVAGQLQVR